MVPSGAAHNEMILGADGETTPLPEVSDEGLTLV
jgi:hypothetical protein